MLRGINVGGKNLIKMADLVACFESHGFEGVSTYIQSGNVLFRTDDSDVAALTSQIEQLLSAAFDYPGTVTLRFDRQMRAIVGSGSRWLWDRTRPLSLRRHLPAATADAGCCHARASA